MSLDPVVEARLVPSTLCACATILVYDWICTLDQEITHVWSRPWSMGTLFFGLNRYLPFVDISVGLSAKLMLVSPEGCLVRNKIVAWLSVMGIFLSEVILMLRTFAIWERKGIVFVLLTFLAASTAVSTVAFTQLELASLEYVPTTGVGCKLAKASSVIIFAYSILMISETTIVILTAVKAYRDLRRSRQPWLVQLYRDGILFYFYLLSISLANILVPLLAPVSPEFQPLGTPLTKEGLQSMFANWLASPQRVLHSVLCTRVLLLIRGQAVRERPLDESVALSGYTNGTLVFASVDSEMNRTETETETETIDSVAHFS
ncbi:hypothetical protein MVEN_02295500 [Mycena venus]|uniref:DUF6533 domain-containing protein n=1 Tax=Mycena venus TaxID=2733690 RepID=A0A8H6X536_9AGAR|nr:hypothetical protein MVEN_02295500 [Mycena venus]